MRVVVAGASSALGVAACSALLGVGHEVVAVGSDAGRLESVPASQREVCDLTDASAVEALAARLGDVDGLLHLVGGWRGGKGLAGQTDDDFDWLWMRLVITLRNTTRAFLPALAASAAGRVAIVSTTGLKRPTASNANYVTCKAAAETWLACVGNALSDAPASVHVERVMALVSDADRSVNPDRDYSRYTDVADLAGRFVAYWG